MPIITHHDLRYSREDLYFQRVLPAYQKLKEENLAFSGLIAQDLANFYHLLSTAIRIDRHPNVKIITQSIQVKYSIDNPIRVFQFQSVWPRSMASDRKYFEGGEEKSELIVLVSQHFFNSFDFQEQIAILGHELSHLLLGHLDIPARQILQQSSNGIEVDVEFHMNLTKWSLCAEISADMFALKAIDYKPKVLATTLIKASSGIQALDSFELIFILLDQYDDLAKSVKSADLTVHPILPLRIKVLDETRHLDLLKKMGEEVTETKLIELKQEYNVLIDSLVFKINPELFDERLEKDSHLFLILGAAVVLSDDLISPEELKLLTKLTSEAVNQEQYFEEIKSRVDASSHTAVSQELILEAIEYCNDKSISNHDIIPVVKFMLHVATANGINLDELKAIYTFANHFDISREEIVILLHQLQ